MSRKLKFRAYQDGEMFYDVMCGGFEETVPIVFRNGDWIHLDQCKVMQYVGLKDKNNKDIYEGDVLKVYDDFFREGLDDRFGIISFENGCFTLGTFRTHPNVCWEQFEIVGNIYENPELIIGGK